MRSARLVLTLMLLPCGLRAQQAPAEEGAAVAAALRAHRASNDTLLLDSISRPAIALRDGQIFEAPIEIAGGGSASVEARVFALRTLITIRYPGMLPEYGDLTGTPERPGTCSGPGPATHWTFRRGVPVPANFNERIAELTTRLIENDSTPFPVRRAAGCAATYPPGPHLDWPPEEFDIIVTAGDIELGYICDHRFVIRNPYADPKRVWYEVQGGSESAVLSLPPADVFGRPSATFFTTSRAGTVRLFENGPDGRLIATEANEQIPCS
jgi:hypothetical protein